MPNKPKVFIGSSSQELPLSRQAADILASHFEVVIWDEPISSKAVFRFNQNFLSELIRASLQFDFGLIIGTADDKVVIKGEEVFEPRDNILFEIGLFIGRLGTRKCAFLVEEDIHVLSDFQGISMAKFNKKDPLSFVQKVEEIKQFFLHNQQVEVNFFPSSTLASVYFENFLVPICKYITNRGGFSIKELHFDKCRINVIIPSRINLDVNLQFEILKKQYTTKTVSFKYAGRPRNISIDFRENALQLEIIDFPTVLSGINYAIQHLLPNEFNEKSKDYEAILSRELERFCSVLELLCHQAGFDELVCLKKELVITH